MSSMWFACVDIVVADESNSMSSGDYGNHLVLI
jgi:hypothetical protein